MFLEEFKSREITFVEWKKVGQSLQESFKADCAEVVRLLTEAVTTFKRNSIQVGYYLCKLEHEGIYKNVKATDCSADCFANQYLSEPFYAFCKRYFGLGKSSVYALKQVYNRFGQENGEPLPAYSAYNYSQLVEMLPLYADELKSVTPDMTVAQIRALKPKKQETKNNVKVSKSKLPKPVFSDMKDKKDMFKKLVKQMFEKFDYKLYLCNRVQAGQTFAGSLFDYLEERGFFYDKDCATQLDIKV